MYHGIEHVQPGTDYQLILTFSNKEVRVFDVRPYLDRGQFRELKDASVFKTVRRSFDTIEWPNGLDLDPEFLYANSVSK